MKLKSFVVVEQDDRYLLICEKSAKHKGEWYLPGGHVAKKENPQVAAIRETAEESGLEITITGIVYLNYDASQMQAALDIFYSGHATGGTLKTEENEHSLGAQWFTFEEISGLTLRDNALEVISAFRNSQAELPLHHFNVVLK